MEGRTPVTLLPSSAVLLDEAAMTVPVVADLDRVMLRRPVDSFPCDDDRAAVGREGR